MNYSEMLTEVSTELGLTKKIVDRTYRAYWKSIRDHIGSLPLKENLTDEQFLQLQPNVNIPSIGKLYVTLDRYHRVKKMYNILQEKHEEKLKNK